jgi:protease-4
LTRLIYKDEFLEELRLKVGEASIKDFKVMKFSKYLDAPSMHDKKIGGDRIAVVYASGNIFRCEGNDETIGSERISKAIRKASSTIGESHRAPGELPGGSALASDVIWREVSLAKKANQSLSQWAMWQLRAVTTFVRRHKVYANPNTLTGSICVFGIIPYGEIF